MTNLSELGPIFPACRRCGRPLRTIPNGGGATEHLDRDTDALACEQRGADELVADYFAGEL